MKKIGIVCEFNPFHNGHLYFINEIKKIFPDSIIVAVMSGNFVERGEVSIINKWDKTNIALSNGIDMVVELPFAFASQSADLFCKGSIQILDKLGVDYIVFGSESNNLSLLDKIASMQLEDSFQENIKKEIKKGYNYPSAIGNVLKKENISSIGPNDTLAIGYLRELKKLNSKIIPYSIKRTNDYHSIDTSSNIISATGVRNVIKNNGDISNFVPYSKRYEYHFNEDYFKLLKYKIISDPDLTRYQSVEEGIENRIKKSAIISNNYEELIQNIKSKRYTYHRISRMLIHILVGFTKEEAKIMKDITYIRVLGFNDNGRNYLKEIKKNINIISKFTKNPMLELEERTSLIYDNSLEHKKKVIKY